MFSIDHGCKGAIKTGECIQYVAVKWWLEDGGGLECGLEHGFFHII